VTLALAACGGSKREVLPAPRTPAPAPPLRPLPAKPRPARELAAVVTVVDGDTGRLLRHGLVALGRHARHVDRTGRARLPLGRRAALPVRVWVRGYSPRLVRLPFARRLSGIVRMYKPAVQWPMYGATPERTQAHPTIRLRPPFRTIWARGLGGLVEFPAVVSDGIAYVTNYRGSVRALSMRNGRLAWRTDTRAKMAASPAVWRDLLVVHGMDGVVRVFRRSNGKVLRRFVVGSPIESSPVVRDGVDYFGAWNGSVYALDLRRNRLRWRYVSGYKITSSAALAGGTLYIGDYGGRLLALTAGTGRLRWAGSVNGRIYGTPAVAGGRVFVPSSTGGSLTAFSIGGARLWRVSTGSYVYSSPAVWKGRVFFGSYNGLLYGVSASSGRVGWAVSTGGAVSGAAVVVDGVVYAGSFAHRILGVDARSGRVLLRFPHGEYVPVSGNGGRLLLHGYSTIWAVQPRGKPTVSPASPLPTSHTRSSR
jgi:outer membrane protein assembly factor BamB